MNKLVLLLLILIGFVDISQAQISNEPWNTGQLMQPETLANRINQKKLNNTLIVNIGPDATIKNSYNAGAGSDDANVNKLIQHLQKHNKTTEVILYCGCCPFNKCPNIRPAFKAVLNAGYKNVKLLNIPKNIKVDWIDKGYPTN